MEARAADLQNDQPKAWRTFHRKVERYCSEHDVGLEDVLNSAAARLTGAHSGGGRRLGRDDVGLREVRHRIRNELQVLMSILRGRIHIGAITPR